VASVFLENVWTLVMYAAAVAIRWIKREQTPRNCCAVRFLNFKTFE